MSGSRFPTGAFGVPKIVLDLENYHLKNETLEDKPLVTAVTK